MRESNLLKLIRSMHSHPLERSLASLSGDVHVSVVIQQGTQHFPRFHLIFLSPVPVTVFVCLCLFVCSSVCPCLFIYMSLSVSISLYLALPPSFLSLPFSLSLSVSIFLSCSLVLTSYGRLFLSCFNFSSSYLTSTSLWRDAGEGRVLCNACGIRYKKYGLFCPTCAVWYIFRTLKLFISTLQISFMCLLASK